MTYIGEKEIDEIKDNLVKFKDGTEKEYTEAQLKYLETDEAKDDTEIMKIVMMEVAPEILNILEKHDIRKGDLQRIIEAVVQSYNESFSIALGKAFGTYEEGRNSAFFSEDIRVSDIKRFKDK